MSTILDNKLNKQKCQKFTPLETVTEMLDLAGYTCGLYGRSVLENSFGSGNILAEIVIRYINDGLSSGLSPQNIADGLANDVYGVELDRELYATCIARLEKIIEEHGIPSVKWSLFNKNALTWECDKRFDYIIGNPPYITYKDIDEDSRRTLRENFDTCADGKFDYCYAFIERGVKLLSQTGKLVQLVPANIYKNVFGHNLRNLLLPHISYIKEYPDKKLFDGTLTSSTIFLYDNSCQTANIEYENTTFDRKLSIARTSLGDKWVFLDQEQSIEKTVRFGDCFHASIVVATLLNEAFLLPPENERERNIEATVIRRAASPKKMRKKTKEYIIFPYFYIGNELQRYAPEEFEQQFPIAAAHLETFRTKLDERDIDENIHWFEYGRTQALKRLNQPKLLISTVITNKAEVYELDAETVPYSGIFITVKKDGYTLSQAKQILQDSRFTQYVKSLGISVSGKSKRITCKDVNNYRFIKE